MVDADKRQFVAALYPGPGWKTKVANMSDEQVFAIWVKEQKKLQELQETKSDDNNGDDIPF